MELLQLRLGKLISVTADEGKNMSGQNKGKIIIKQIDSASVAPLVFHCIVYQEVLCAKVLP